MSSAGGAHPAARGSDPQRNKTRPAEHRRLFLLQEPQFGLPLTRSLRCGSQERGDVKMKGNLGMSARRSNLRATEKGRRLKAAPLRWVAHLAETPTGRTTRRRPVHQAGGPPRRTGFSRFPPDVAGDFSPRRKAKAKCVRAGGREGAQRQNSFCRGKRRVPHKTATCPHPKGLCAVSLWCAWHDSRFPERGCGDEWRSGDARPGIQSPGYGEKTAA